MTPEQLILARKIALTSEPTNGIALLVAHIDAQAAEIDDISALRTVLRESDWAFESHQYSTEWQYMASCDRISRIVAHIDAQAAEIERLSGMLQKARDGLSCGLWDYGPGQSEHDQCDELIAEIDKILKGAK